MIFAKLSDVVLKELAQILQFSPLPISPNSLIFKTYFQFHVQFNTDSKQFKFITLKINWKIWTWKIIMLKHFFRNYSFIIMVLLKKKKKTQKVTAAKSNNIKSYYYVYFLNLTLFSFHCWIILCCMSSVSITRIGSARICCVSEHEIIK